MSSIFSHESNEQTYILNITLTLGANEETLGDGEEIHLMWPNDT